MARLDPGKRAKLPDSAFAYVDSRGQRRLPIHDEAHVRNALARFNQVAFEDARARDRARKRLLNAAKKHGIVPVGFITGQLQSERERGHVEAREPVELPSGGLTMLMSDIEGSTALVHRLGDRYRELLNEVRAVQTTTTAASGGHVVDARADEFFAVFERPDSALSAAVAIQRELRGRTWVDDSEVRLRIGMHTGNPTLTEANYIGMPVHITARVSAAAHGGQILVTGEVKRAVRGSTPEGIRFTNLGSHPLRGIPDPVLLFQIRAKGLAGSFPPLRTVGRA